MIHHFYRRSRYDLITGNSGVRLITDIREKVFVHGPRRSGRTTYLIKDLQRLLQERPDFRVLFVVETMVMKRLIKIKSPNVDIRSTSEFSRLMGVRYQAVYVDGVEELRKRNWDELERIVSRAVRVVVSSLIPMKNLYSENEWKYYSLRA